MCLVWNGLGYGKERNGGSLCHMGNHAKAEAGEVSMMYSTISSGPSSGCHLTWSQELRDDLSGRERLLLWFVLCRDFGVA